MTHPVQQWVFGYGSLVSETRPVRIGSGTVSPRWVSLNGYRRSWDVAMENRGSVNDHKHYIDPLSGARPDVYAAFLNIGARPGESCVGLAIPVDDSTLPALDHREINYRRMAVTDLISPRLEGTVWSYVALDAGRERFETGLRTGNVYLAREYRTFVEAAHAEGNPGGLEAFRATTDPPACPERDLTLVHARPRTQIG